MKKMDFLQVKYSIKYFKVVLAQYRSKLFFLANINTSREKYKLTLYKDFLRQS